MNRQDVKTFVFKAWVRGLALMLCLFFILGCGEKEKSPEELVLGNWTQYRNRAYTLLILNPKGTWDSSVRVADASEKIVRSKGSAKGSWHIEEGQLIFTVMESDIEEVWEKNDTSFFEIVELEDRRMVLKEENGRMAEWNKTGGKQGQTPEGQPELIISMAPYAVNLNKLSSNTEDRYLCMNMSLVLKELMPDQQVPEFHPRARDAVILFLSSLVYGDVENFEKIKAQKKKLVNLINPYMEGFVKDVKIEHVIIASSVEKVEEFIIEHTLGRTDNAQEEAEQGASEEDG